MKLRAVCALVTAACVLATGHQVRATPSALSVGDQLVYSVTTELQQHRISSGPAGRDVVTESSAQGTETFTVYAIGNDGTAYANVALDFKGESAGQPMVLERIAGAKISRDGQLRLDVSTGLGINEAVSFANSTVAEIDEHQPLHSGLTWSKQAKTAYLSLSMARRVVGRTGYRGFTAYALASNGTGALLRTTDDQPASGSITVSGTLYYDDRNRLVIGQALRTLTVAQQPGSATEHENYSAQLDMVLDLWKHALAPAQATTALPAESNPSPAFQPSTAPTETTVSPSPAPSTLEPTAYPTVTPGRRW